MTIQTKRTLTFALILAPSIIALGMGLIVFCFAVATSDDGSGTDWSFFFYLFAAPFIVGGILGLIISRLILKRNPAPK